MLRRPYSVGALRNDLVNAITRELSRSGIYLSTADIQKNADEMGDYLDNRGACGEDELITKLRAKLARDKESSGGQGLHRSRCQFYIFCHAARHIDSVDLAEALLRFLERNTSQIDQEEKSFLMTEWCHGLLQLKGLVDEDRWNEALQKVANRGPPMFEEWRRPGLPRSWAEEMVRLLQNTRFHDLGGGRHCLQSFDLPAREPSVPARRPSVMGMPSFPYTGYSSPLLSPLHDSFDQLQAQQHRQQFDIAMLEYHMENLRHRH